MDLIAGLSIKRDSVWCLVGKEIKQMERIPCVHVVDGIKFSFEPARTRNGNSQSTMLDNIFSKAFSFFENYQASISHLSISTHGPYRKAVQTDSEGNARASIEKVTHEDTRFAVGGADLGDYVTTYFGYAFSQKTSIVHDGSAVALGEFVRRMQAKRVPFSDGDPRTKTVVALLFGRGVGGGICAGGQVWSGHLHSEMGHISVGMPRNDSRISTCQHHGHDCLHGLASTDALNVSSDGTMTRQQMYQLSQYVARLAQTVTCVLSPSSIVIGGSLMWQNPECLELIRTSAKNLFIKGKASYFTYDELLNEDFLDLSDQSAQHFGTLYSASTEAWRTQDRFYAV